MVSPLQGDVLMSLFINELYGFQLDNWCWYPLELRKEKSTKVKSVEEIGIIKRLHCFGKSSQDDVEMSVTDEDEKMEDTEEANEMQCDMQEIFHQMGKSLACDEVTSREVSNEKVLKLCGCINACMVVGRDALYFYGGMMEVRDREITLDDLYSLNLSKLDE